MNLIEQYIEDSDIPIAIYDKDQFMKTTLTDNDPMPWGKYKGTAMANVPASYFLWLWNKGIDPGAVRNYIKDNLEVFQKEIKK